MESGILPEEPEEVPSEEVLNLAKSLALKNIQTMLAYGNFVIRKVRDLGVILDYSYSISNTPRGFTLVLRFDVADVNAEKLLKNRARVKAIIRSGDIMKKIYRTLIAQQQEEEQQASQQSSEGGGVISG